MKLTIAALLSVIALLTLLMLGSEPPEATDVSARRSDSTPRTSDRSPLVGEARARSRATAEGVNLAPRPPTPEPALAVRVVDVDGNPIASARGAWVDDQRDVFELAFDAGGRAPRPSPGAGLALVRASGYLGRTVATEAATESARDVLVTLSPDYEIRGEVRVEGEPPEAALCFERLVSHVQYGLDVRDDDLVPRLVDLVLPAYSTPVPVDPGGTFAATVEWELDLVPLYAPAGYRFREVVGAALDYGPDWAIGGPEHRALEIELVRVPSLVGRVEWEDGEPFAGEIVSLMATSGSRERPLLRQGRTESDGSFTISIVDGSTAATGSFEERVEALDLREVILSTYGQNVERQQLARVDLSDAACPFDVGRLVARRSPRVDVQVFVRRDGVEAPVRSVVTTPIASTWTDEEGRATLAFRPEEAVHVLAKGCRPARALSPAAGETLRVVLDPAPSFSVSVDRAFRAASRGLRLRLTYRETPFELVPDPESTPALPMAAYATFSRPLALSYSYEAPGDGIPSELVFEAPRDAPLFVPGLRVGAALTVELLDPLGGTLDLRRITVPADDVVAHFSSAEIESTELTIDLRWSDGTPVESGRVRVRGRGDRPATWFAHLPTDALHFAPITLGDVDVVTDVPGARNVQLRAVPVAPGAPPLAIVLERE